MSRLSITTAWNEAADIVKRDFGALFTIALAMIAVPSVIFQSMAPAAAGVGQATRPWLWLLLAVAVLVLTLAGALAISSLALGRENVVGSAIARGFRRCLPLLGSTLLLGIAAFLLLLPFVLFSGVSPEDLKTPSAATISRLSWVLMAYGIVLIGFWTRLLPMTPVAAAETGGPIAIIRRSWKLTSGHFWRLLGFVLLMVVVLLVVMMSVTSVVGLLIAAILGPPQPGTLPGLVLLLIAAVVNAAFGVVFSAMIARIYVQLAGEVAKGS